MVDDRGSAVAIVPAPSFDLRARGERLQLLCRPGECGALPAEDDHPLGPEPADLRPHGGGDSVRADQEEGRIGAGHQRCDHQRVRQPESGGDVDGVDSARV